MKKTIVTIFFACMLIGTLSACNTASQTDQIDTTENKEDTHNWEMNVKEERIEIEGLTKEYEFLYITDMHIVTESATNPEEVKQYAIERLPQFVNAEGITSAEQFPKWIAYANDNAVDGVLLGGDFIDSPSDSNITYLEKQLQELKVPYLYTLGNHDWTYPWDYMSDQGKASYIPKLNPYMQNSPFIQSMETEEFIIASIDNSTNQIAPEALEEYKALLQKGKPVIVMLHVPLYTDDLFARAKKVWSSPVTLGGGVHGGIYPNDVSTEFLNLTKADDSPVVMVLAGHVHLYHKDMLNEKILQIVGDAGFKGQGIRLKLIPAKE